MRDFPTALEQISLDRDNRALVITGSGDSFMDQIDGPSLVKPAARQPRTTTEIVDAQASDAYERADGLLTGTRLDDLLDALPAQQRQVIALRYGMTGRRASDRPNRRRPRHFATPGPGARAHGFAPPARAQLTGRVGAGSLKRAPLQDVAGRGPRPATVVPNLTRLGDPGEAGSRRRVGFRFRAGSQRRSFRRGPRRDP